MVTTIGCDAGHLRKLSRSWVLHLRGQYRMGGIIEARTAASAHDKHFAVRQDHCILLASGELHVAGEAPGRSGGSKINGLRSSGRRIAAAYLLNFACVIHHSRTVVPPAAE